MKLLPFTKMHGAGNDFVVLDGVSGELSYAFHNRDEDYPLRAPRTDLLPGEFEWIWQPWTGDFDAIVERRFERDEVAHDCSGLAGPLKRRRDQGVDAD